jgi:hypothetical protein
MIGSRFANDGGPLIALDREDAPSWGGNTGADREHPIPSGSDYERACQSHYPVGLVSVGTGLGVVIGAKEGIAEAWWAESLGGSEIFLVGCVFGDEETDRELTRYLHSAGDWSRVGIGALKSGHLLLFHAASVGSELAIQLEREYAKIGDALPATIVPGHYSLLAREVALGDRALYNVARWTLGGA